MKKRVKIFVRRLIFCTALLVFCAPLFKGAVATDAPTVFIRVNQLGFGPHDVKTAVAFSGEPLPADFRVVDVASGAVVLTAKTRRLTGTWGEFAYHAELDFTRIQRAGKYLIKVGGASSVEFVIDKTEDRNVADQLLDFMRQQRCGYNPYVAAACHTLDGRTAYGPLPPGTYINASGGWHDAGDQLKYLLTSSNATAQMLLAYELATESSRKQNVFADHFNNFGQPGANGIPDVLDEARWGSGMDVAPASRAGPALSPGR